MSLEDNIEEEEDHLEPAPDPMEKKEMGNENDDDDDEEEEPDQINDIMDEEEEMTEGDEESQFDVEMLPDLNFGDGKTLKERSWKVKLRGEMRGSLINRMRQLRTGFERALDSVLASADPEATAQLFVEHGGIYKGAVASKKGKAKELSADSLLDRVEAIVQSAKAQGDDIAIEDLKWSLVLYKPRFAGARHNRTELELEDYQHNSRSIVDLSSPGYRLNKKLRNSCLLNHICLAVERLNSPDNGAIAAISFVRKDLLKKVTELAAAAGLSPEGPHQLADIKKIHKTLGQEEYQICVYFAYDNKPELTHGPSTAPKHINLYVADPDQEPLHITLITKMHTVMKSGKGGFCELCKSPHGTGRHHCAAATCGLCKLATCTNTKEASKLTRCSVCFFDFWSDACFLAHKVEQCKKNYKCPVCRLVIQKKDLIRHRSHCGQPFCHSCKIQHFPFIPCYVQTGRKPGEKSLLGDDFWPEDQPDGEVYRSS